VTSAFGLIRSPYFYSRILTRNNFIRMDASMNINTFNFKGQEPMLPDNNEAVIHMLGLDAFADCNTGKLVDDIVKNLDIDSFMLTPSGEPVAAIGFESIQGHPQFVGNTLANLQPTETISYVDLSPVSPPQTKNSPYHVPENTYMSPVASPPALKNSPSYEGSLFINEEAFSTLGSSQDVSSLYPTTPVEDEDKSVAGGGGKAPRRRRELKAKLYEREEPLSDPEEEKKRQNAINAKKNRDKQKNRLQELDALVKSLTTERDTLQVSNNKLRNKCNAFETQLKNVCQQFNVPVIILPQD